MQAKQTDPFAVADLPPWPALPALDGPHLASLTGFDLVTELRVQYRSQARQRAIVLAAVYETALRSYGSAHHVERMPAPDGWSGDEIRAALGLTRTAAENLLAFAHAVCVRQPELHAAMLAGDLDEPRARVLVEWTADLSAAHSFNVCATLLPRCALTADPMLTTGQLREEVKRLAIALDPGWAQRRYENSLRERRVVGSRNADGTADLAGYQLPVERVAAACRRIDALAKAAKHEGDPRTIDQVRADLFCGMTDGTYQGLTDRQILAHLTATRPEPDPDDTPGQIKGWITAFAARHAARQAQDRGPTTASASTLQDSSPANTRATGSDATGSDAAGSPLAGTAGTETAASASVHAGPTAPAGPGHPSPLPGPRPPLPTPSRAGVELRVRLSTLLGLDRLPGELAGWGPVHAELARTLVADLGPGQWRYALTDEHGHLITAGLTPARPTGARLRSAHSKALVDIVIPAALLTDLTSGDLATRIQADPARALGWRPVIADITRRTRAPGATGPPPDPDRRTPGAHLQREIEMGTSACVGVGCRAPASTCDLDHRVDYARGGPTIRENLDPACRHDHRMKHEAGWKLTRITGGHRWTSRLGHTYTVPTPPVIALSATQEPLVVSSRDSLGRPWQDSARWQPDPEPPPPPPPPPDLNEEPPF